MTAQNAATHEIVTFGDLKPLAAANGPCLTAVVPLPKPAEIETRMKNAIRGLENRLAECATDPDTSSDLLAPIVDLTATAQMNGIWSHAIRLKGWMNNRQPDHIWPTAPTPARR